MSTVQGLRTSLLAGILFGVTLTVGPSRHGQRAGLQGFRRNGRRRS